MLSKTFQLLVPPGPVSRNGEPVYPAVIPRGPLIAAGRAWRSGWATTVFDGYSFPTTVKEFVARAQHDATVLGVSVHGAPSVAPARTIVSRVRQFRADAPFVIGGNLVNVAANLLTEVFSDCLLFEGGANVVIRALDEAANRGAGGVFKVSEPDVSWDLPALDRSFIPLSRYLDDPDFEYHLPTQIGCPFRCFHCGTGRRGLVAKVIRRPEESLAEELDWLLDWCRSAGMKPPRLWITDETFTSSPEHLASVLSAFRSRPEFSWRAQTRVDAVDARSLREMRLAGCHTISFGVEVPTDAGLTLFGKRELMERVEFAFRNAREARLRVQAILVFGAPEDRSTFEDVFTTLAGLKPDSLQSYLYHPVPGSPWWRKFGSTINLATTEGWSTLDFHSPPILGGGYTHQRDAIGRFLASLVWSASPLTVRGRQLREHLQEGYACPRCAAEVKANILDAHDNVIVFGLHSDAGELLIAAGPSEIVAHPLHGRDNLYEGLFWCMDVQPDEAMIRLCPRCGILPDFSERDVGEITTYGERESAFTGGAT